MLLQVVNRMLLLVVNRMLLQMLISHILQHEQSLKKHYAYAPARHCHAPALLCNTLPSHAMPIPWDSLVDVSHLNL